MTGVPGRPQSWNRYAYVLNNPLIFIDPDGLRWAERKLENGNIEYGWFTTDLEYDVATNNGWSAVHFDESKPYEYQAPSLGDERYNMYRLNPDGTHGYGRILDGQGVGTSTAWDMQFAIGGLLNSARIGLGAGLESLAATFGRSAAKEATATGLSSDGLAFELKFLNKHLPGTAEASKEIAKGSAHVFKDLSTLSRVESEIFSRGVNTGTLNGWTRIGARFTEPIGIRIGKDGTTTALNYGEMKLKDGLYHIIPRTGPR